MRLTPHQTEQIAAVVRRHFGGDAAIALHGSRLDGAARGGDVDLLVDSPAAPTLLQRAAAKMELEGVLLMLVDILAAKRGEAGRALVQAVRPRAVVLGVAA